MLTPNILDGWQGQFNPNLTATIANGQTTSGAIQLGGMCLCGILLPAAFTGTALTFLASPDGVTYKALKAGTGGSALSYTVAQDTFAAIDPKDFQGVNFLKIVSGSAEAGARTLKLAVKGL